MSVYRHKHINIAYWPTIQLACLCNRYCRCCCLKKFTHATYGYLKATYESVCDPKYSYQRVGGLKWFPTVQLNMSYILHPTYIIGHYNHSVRIIDLASHTIYVVCVNFTHKRRDEQFKVVSEWQIWDTFHGNLIFSQSFCQKSAERKSPKKKYSFWILIWCLAWDSTLALRLICERTTY